MSKVYLNVDLKLIVDADLQSLDDIMDDITIDVYGNDNVDIQDCTIDNYEVEGAK